MCGHQRDARRWLPKPCLSSPYSSLFLFLFSMNEKRQEFCGLPLSGATVSMKEALPQYGFRSRAAGGTRSSSYRCPRGTENGRFLTEPSLSPRCLNPRGRAHGTAAAAGRSGSGRGKVSPVLAPSLPLHTHIHTRTSASAGG